jgi:hypothetical protein
MGHLLAPIALFLFVLLYVVDWIIMIVKNIKRRAFFETTSKKNYTKSFLVDIMGYWVFKDSFNFLFCKKETPLFNKFGESISSALGRGYYIGNRLSKFGWVFKWILDIVWITDWFNGGHCKVSIMNDLDIRSIKKKYFELIT